MKINERLYPHPVLAHFSDDVVNSLFQVTPKVVPGRTTYKFDVIAKTSNKSLKALVESSKAQYALHIECASTRFRKIVSSSEEQFSTEINAAFLDGRVELCSLIIATAEISEYINENFHPDYGGMSFKVKKGDVLAVGQDLVFDAEKEMDPLQHISSIFKVRQGNEGDPPFTVYPEELIIIYLSPDNYSAYAQMKGDSSKQIILASMIILPALVQVLEMIKSSVNSGDAEDNSDRRYYRVISKKLRELGYNPQDSNFWEQQPCLVIAQKLVGDPLTSALKIMMEEEDFLD